MIAGVLVQLQFAGNCKCIFHELEKRRDLTLAQIDLKLEKSV